MNHLVKPIITEKSMLDAARGVYTFEVMRGSTKSQVREIVQELFKVNVLKINTTTTKPASKKTGRKRLPTSTSPVKLARVWLKSGQTITLFDIKEEN